MANNMPTIKITKRIAWYLLIKQGIIERGKCSIHFTKAFNILSSALRMSAKHCGMNGIKANKKKRAAE